MDAGHGEVMGPAPQAAEIHNTQPVVRYTDPSPSEQCSLWTELTVGIPCFTPGTSFFTWRSTLGPPETFTCDMTSEFTAGVLVQPK